MKVCIVNIIVNNIVNIIVNIIMINLNLILDYYIVKCMLIN
jgi:hypothetical protein